MSFAHLISEFNSNIKEKKMTLIKWINRPTLFDEVDQWLDNLSIYKPINFNNGNSRWMPQFELREINDSYQIFAEIPGMSKKDINLEVVDNSLRISGEKSRDEKDYISEYSYGKFERTFNLPDDVILDKVSAKMKDGILAIYVPKLEPVKPEVKKIAIK